ncbi:MAG: hypothetical protein IT384_10120 [Deltaproteobacteria bacterium]|nr:hypothetical protein [Deltaproteobacteria bacterium]
MPKSAPAEVQSPLGISGVLELGFLAPLAHTIELSKSGTELDYVRDGGQDNLFFVARLSGELALFESHRIIFLYQPLNLETSVLLEKDLVVDDERFVAGTALDLRYGFDFYRLSYLYDFWGDDPRQELSIGGSLQLRNATINFTSGDGTQRRTARDIGPVPALKVRGQWSLTERVWLGLEADGMYAPIKYLNGGASDVVGAILDASVRAGIQVAPGIDAFLNVRYLGGGASGTSKKKSGPGDGYTDNWLNFLFITLGVRAGPFG